METTECTHHNIRQNCWTKQGNINGIIQMHEIGGFCSGIPGLDSM